MNRTRHLGNVIFSLVGALCVALPSGLILAQAKNWKDITFPPLKPFSIPQPARHVLSNGIVIFLMEDHELPLINLTALVRTGERHMPAEKAGMGDIFGEVWRTGGTTTRTGDQLDDFLETRAAKVETSMGGSSASVNMNCLKGDFPDVFKIFSELLREPAFAEAKIDIAKNNVKTQIARRNDSPGEIVYRESTKLGYGAQSPYAIVPEYATVASVTRRDLVDWQKKYVHPNRILIGVVGDFDSKEMLATLTKAFGSWPKGPDFTDPEPFYQKKPKPGVYFIEKNDVTKASVHMVHLGTMRSNPDYYAIDVFNEILSGGFASRLFSNVRSKKGLAYSVGGGIGTGYDYPGLLRVEVDTKNSTVAAGLDALYEEIDGLLGKKPATEEELKRAKDSILNSFIFRFDSKEKVLNEQLIYAYYGYPADFLQRYRAGIEKVTLDDVARVAKKYIHPDQFAVLVVGKPSEFDRPLSSFGQVTKLDITIPQPEGLKTMR
ncbi:MAG: insulinase family protein [Acidobacteria bacterium]|nr:MAG: insulinase family protein [Acidobacteriota bacterium]